MTGEQNYRLLEEIEANRNFILMAYRQNPRLLASAEDGIRRLFAPSDRVGPAADAVGNQDCRGGPRDDRNGALLEGGVTAGQTTEALMARDTKAE